MVRFVHLAMYTFFAGAVMLLSYLQKGIPFCNSQVQECSFLDRQEKNQKKPA